MSHLSFDFSLHDAEVRIFLFGHCNIVHPQLARATRNTSAAPFRALTLPHFLVSKLAIEENALSSAKNQYLLVNYIIRNLLLSIFFMRPPSFAGYSSAADSFK
jgi:hypothetical protein